MVPVFFSSSGILLAVLLYGFSPLRVVFNLKMSSIGQLFYNFFNRKWFFDKVYNEYINQVVLNLGYSITYKVIDRGLIENLGPFGLSNLFYNRVFNVLKLQTGLLYHYTFVFLVGAVLLITSLGFFSFSMCFNLFMLFVFFLLIFLVNINKLIK